jgi:uncharacterized protein YkwD
VLVRVQRRATVIAVAVLGLLALGGLTNALPASAATKKHHRRHHARRHASDSRRCAGADTPVGAASTAELRATVVCLINDARASHGLPAVSSSSRLNRSAQSWTNSMVGSDQFSEGNPGARVSAVGFDWSTVGENIATGFPTPRQAVSAWMASQGHCYNILDPAFTRVGTGVNRGEVRGYGSRPGTWTQDFGLPMGSRSRSNNWGPADHCPY